ncbi:MAG: hypothetical protein LE168_01200 [Endomicrobium sp.]|nr:hypothetical protein [Endomicrobium sp.]
MLNVDLDFCSAAGKVIQIMGDPLADEFKNVLSKILTRYDKQLTLTEMARKTDVEQLGFYKNN